VAAPDLQISCNSRPSILLPRSLRLHAVFWPNTVRSSLAQTENAPLQITYDD
jgi:hypothetical protein